MYIFCTRFEKFQHFGLTNSKVAENMLTQEKVIEVAQNPKICLIATEHNLDIPDENDNNYNTSCVLICVFVCLCISFSEMSSDNLYRRRRITFESSKSCVKKIVL